MKKHLLVLTFLSVLGTAPLVWAEDFIAIALGASEVPPVPTQTLGLARFSTSQSGTRIEVQMFVFNGDAVTQAHIHCAPSGQNGPVVVFLAGLIDNGHDIDGRWISNAKFKEDNIIPGSVCGDTLGELLIAMRSGNTYVNVHTVANPGGEVRGQIRPTP